MVIWSWAVGFLLLGYLSMTRTFAYLGIPPFFIGEIVLAAFVLLKPRVALGTWVDSLLRASPLHGLSLAFLIFFLYGFWQLERGVLGGAPVLYTLKFFIFNYYVLYLLLGMWVGIQAPDFLPKLIRILAWFHGVYGLVWLVALREMAVFIPGSDVPLFGFPAGGAVAILGLLCFERYLRAVWPILVLNIMIVLAMQARAMWLGLAAGILTWGLVTGRLSRVVAVGVGGLVVLGMVEISGFQVGSGSSRSATISRDVVGIVIAPINIELAKQLSPRAVMKMTTGDWRKRWWDQIWHSVHSTPMREAFGHGYGFDLFGLAPDDVRAGQAEEIRTPHSVFYYALGHTGWAGVILFGALQLSILKLLWRSYRLTGQPAGVVFWVMGMSMALFEESFDSPYKAIPFYLLLGLSIAPGLRPPPAPCSRTAAY
jgi:hypothetical protein